MGWYNTLLSPLYTVVSWVIVQFHSVLSPLFGRDSGWSWGLSIVFLTVLIRVCLIPLFVKQIKATRSMQAIQPKMKAIQERYKNDRQRQSEEMMKLYKEAGTNPFASCLPIIIQMPFFSALFGVLNHVSHGQTVGVINQSLLGSAQHAHIFGAPLSVRFLDSASKIHSLGASVGDVRVVSAVMIVLMALSQFITQRQLMTKNVDTSVKTPMMQQQKMLMYVFPVMFAVFGINFPVGVLVYWLTTNVWSMGQQLVVIRRNPTPGSIAFKERQARLKAKGKIAADGTPIKGAGLAGLVKGGQPQAEVEVAEPEAPQVRRQQPKRTTKSQRQGGGTATATEAPATPAQGRPQAEAPRDRAPQPAKKAAQAKGASQQAKGTQQNKGAQQAKGTTPAQKKAPQKAAPQKAAQQKPAPQKAAGSAKSSGTSGAAGGKRSPQPAGQRPKKKS